jgi:RimJ/RimL family protein N-acetyltransferase
VRLPRLETDRLIIRPLTIADAGALDLAVEEVQPGWLEWTAATYEQLEALHQPPYGERAIELRETGELAGLVGVVPSMGPFAQLPGFGPAVGDPARLRPEVGLFWSLAPDHRGNGYATEAARAVIEHGFRVLELARFVATTERDNAASIAVMRRLGMRVEENPLPEPPWFQVVGWVDPP